MRRVRSFAAQPDDSAAATRTAKTIVVGRSEDFPAGSCINIEIAENREVAVYNVRGELFATDNFCPHRGARLSDGILCGHIIECYLHGWQFDVRSGECFTVSERIETYRVIVEDGLIKIEV
jgi:naphthalene 1,2-dioxygenase ferredoxin component